MNKLLITQERLAEMLRESAEKYKQVIYTTEDKAVYDEAIADFYGSLADWIENSIIIVGTGESNDND